MIRHRNRPTRHRPTHPIGYQETTQRTVLRGGKESDLVCSVSHGTPRCEFELRRGDQRLLAGEWPSDGLAGSLNSGSNGVWTTACSEVNEESEYAELQLPLEGGGSLERQVFLARRDQFLFIADVVLGTQRLAGEYRLALPLADGVEFKAERDTQEGRLFRGRTRLATVLPLSLPEWRREPGGALEGTAEQITLRLSLEGQRAHAACFIDLDPRRQGKPLTWRRLTVAESLRGVPSDVAVGYRVQVGTSQWLFYRSLAERGNRTVLGQNFSTEFVAARFPASGVADKLLEIE